MGVLPLILLGGLGYLLYSKKKLTLGEFAIEAKRKSANDPETGGWAPGWWRTRDRYKSRAEAQAAIDRYGKKGARYRIKSALDE